MSRPVRVYGWEKIIDGISHQVRCVINQFDSADPPPPRSCPAERDAYCAPQVVDIYSRVRKNVFTDFETTAFSPDSNS